ncbi:MAG: SCO1664 family protein [Candidatus Rokubacteria bacterium]|nr:SCO1664 family protein [Candidatus Rokubacteria bacterium]
MPWSSNATFLVELTLDGRIGHAVYKPRKGERPLWDFPPALYRREIAAYLLSEALGWGLVPLTLEREGPFGAGSFQRFVDADFEQHYFTLREDPAHHDRLRQICLFDLVANNADRKSGHCLLAEGAVHAIDNGLTFHVEPKLRTVIWDFGGEPVPPALRADLERVVNAELPGPLAALLSRDERDALAMRGLELLEAGVFPVDESGMRYPWPLV